MALMSPLRCALFGLLLVVCGVSCEVVLSSDAWNGIKNGNIPPALQPLDLARGWAARMQAFRAIGSIRVVFEDMGMFAIVESLPEKADVAPGFTVKVGSSSDLSRTWAQTAFIRQGVCTLPSAGVEQWPPLPQALRSTGPTVGLVYDYPFPAAGAFTARAVLVMQVFARFLQVQEVCQVVLNRPGLPVREVHAVQPLGTRDAPAPGPAAVLRGLFSVTAPPAKPALAPTASPAAHSSLVSRFLLKPFAGARPADPGIAASLSPPPPVLVSDRQ